MMTEKSTSKGTYIFISRLNTAKDIRFNVKGDVHHFPRGWYAYIGSAFNSGGIKTRLNRHFYGTGNGPWNIDFFRKGVIPHNRAWVSYQDKRLEREWSSAFQLMDDVTVPILNIGNSDDRGKSLIPGVKKSHLFHCKMKFNLKAFQAVVEEYFPGNDPVVEIQLPI
jgi:Uri superfamily endonuclease